MRFQGVAPSADQVELSGKPVDGFVAGGFLQPANDIGEVFLKSLPRASSPVDQLRVANVSNMKRAIFEAISRVEGQPEAACFETERIVLNYKHDDTANVSFNIYRDGQLCVEGIRGTTWVDNMSGDYRNTVHTYSVQAVNLWNGNVSHLSQSRSFRLDDQRQVIPAKAMHNDGTTISCRTIIPQKTGGKPRDRLGGRTSFQVHRGGRYLVRAEFSNGAGPVSSGITCAVKKLEIKKAGSGEVVASGYLVMPQSGDWTRWDLSSSVNATLDPAGHYVIRIFEDEYCRNMSYLENNARYTAGQGGGEQSSNYVNIANVHLLNSGTRQRAINRPVKLTVNTGLSGQTPAPGL